MPLEPYGNPDHKCRNPKCGKPMPLPQMWGKFCRSCGWRQPTLDELRSRLDEPVEIDPDFAPTLAGMLGVDIDLDDPTTGEPSVAVVTDHEQDQMMLM
jgi:hypothetical protein